MSSTSPFLEERIVEFMVCLGSPLHRRVAEAVEGGGAVGRVASCTCSAWQTLARKAVVVALVVALATSRLLLG
jgi:hypothetical protein